MEFLDRIEECARLERLLDSSKGEFGCIYGRRRCGKSRLLTEVIANRPNAVYFLADRNEKMPQIRRAKEEIARVVPVFRNFEVNDWGQLLDLWLQLAPHGSF